MIGYYVRLALNSFKRAPGLTALMVLAIATGIAVCVVSLTVFHAMSGNPIWWKSDKLYNVTMDSYDPNAPEVDARKPGLPPNQMTYRDANALRTSGIPARVVVMHQVSGVIVSGAAGGTPNFALGRVTTGDFFGMFEVPFLYGGGWKREADESFEPVVVLSYDMNQKLFGGANSVGRTVRWNDRELRVLGVLDRWNPIPKFYDLSESDFAAPEDVYIPWSSVTALKAYSSGSTNCWKAEPLDTFDALLVSECVWVQMWVELPDAATREKMAAFIDAHWARERGAGRFARPKNNRLTDVDQWLIDERVVQDDNRVLVGLAFAFLAVCVINTVGLLLAKFLNAAPIAGVRRALGASRKALFAQHLVEVGVVSLAGAVLGLGLGALGLYAVRIMYSSSDPNGDGYQALAHFDTASILWAVLLAILSALAAGLYPAWRIGRVQPSVYLKNQ